MATTKKAKKKTSARKCGTRKCATKKAAPAKKVAAKKTAAKKAPAKKAAAPTATDQVLKVVKRFKKGVNVPGIVERTGLGDKTVRNIIARTYKQGKIKRVDRGLYVAA